jgi:glycosyltransferase involved in cell wall biosynthesis
MSDLKASVVLCTYNPREDYLRRVLEGLRAQTLPLAQWELLIVDNASKIPVADRYDLSWHPQGRIIREEKLGKMHAWFKGINEAKGDILLFLDDDNVLDSNYLEQVLLVAEQWPFIGAWGASVVPEFESTPPSWMKDEMWRLSIDEVREDVWSNLREGFETKPLGAGMCVRKKVGIRYLEWCRANEMSNVLDRKGKGDLIAGYGEMNLALCAIDIGLGTGKSARLRLTHLIPSSRLTLDYFVRHAEGDAASLQMFRAIRGLSLKESRQSLFKTIKWQIYKALSGQPGEILKIREAHLRGVRRGLEMAQDYLEKQQSNAPGRQA